MSVVDLAAEREARTPHATGEAVSLACPHTWTAVAPTGTVWLTCPACELERGRFKYPFSRTGAHWECACGNDLFHCTREGVYCPNCGVWQTFGDSPRHG